MAFEVRRNMSSNASFSTPTNMRTARLRILGSNGEAHCRNKIRDQSAMHLEMLFHYFQ